MSHHLLALAVGPVQELIAAARRTRDFWFGSQLLSEISKAAAKSIQEHGELIFPAPQSADDLEPGSRMNVANVILAELRDSDPEAVAKAAKHAAQARWRTFADQVLSSHRDVINIDIWDDQVDDVIELYAAWVVHSPATYQADRARLMRLLAGRKRCRDFLPARGRAGIPKSSLDGLRESVLLPPRQWPEHSRRRLRVREGEQLDVVALVKRTWAPASASPSYPSVARVAADPWLRGLGDEELAHLRDACRSLGPAVIHELDISAERGQPEFARFPFEGTAVYRSRHSDLQQEAELLDPDLVNLEEALKQATRRFDEPGPYLAVLVADGDRMGQAISSLASPDVHRAFSKVLTAFAGNARSIVQQNSGVLVYAGGDDVLAFVPVDRCLACARALHDAFSNVRADGTDIELTLSVGVAVAHFMEPLEDLLAYGRAAEKHAKQPRPEDGEQRERNALAVHVVKRGGGALAVRANWSEDMDRQLLAMASWIESGAIPDRVAYELRAIASHYDGWPTESVEAAIQCDMLALLKRKQPVGISRMSDVEDLIRTRVVGADSLRRLGKELLVARQIALAGGHASRISLAEKPA